MSKQTLVLAVAIIIAAVATISIASSAILNATIQSARADGVGNAKNFGQCKKDFPNGNGCASTKGYTESSSPVLTEVAQTCVNGGGNTPNGNCNGEGLHVENPAGHQPPGQQP